MSGTFAGRTALVSGAGNGLGQAMARRLYAAGARLILVGRDLSKLEAARQQIEAPADRCRIETCDVADPGSVAELAETLHDEQISILVNNAGVPGPVADLVDIDPDDWDAVFATNVRGVFLMCQAFLPPMIAAGAGDIVNVASVSGKRPLARRTPYCASKMAVIGLTTTLAAETGPFGVRVNTLSPGPVKGPRMERNFRLEAERTGVSRDEAEQAFVGRSALGRMVEEDEVGQALVAMLQMPGLTAADIDLSAGMVAR
ncbi:SDR family NAD(P)-dependent oxidoreductase [Nocardioides panzhihuensis]|uniref:NAD(P)-dependent dehydrogenase (Short-subunit alcohol dehydrogenase family) n=1 Tax=Nocardioides panzhihuensis TaxID=860243 RepID=A0A7Z0DNJ3_9ACTN|nr:SDR family NAD(P)-dependent oxidoreductase [Nocardioides panzhihuensis]NYI78914.1 NAD(P)-dependent dehydrogenase (short-subunit alcohol dehydrogenase family) [Nocardioides panzhihuensis]